jgi:hypothetical protein
MKEDLVAQGNSCSSENAEAFVFDFRRKDELRQDIESLRDAVEIFKNLRYRYSETLWWYEKHQPCRENEEVRMIVETCNKKMQDYDRLIELMKEYEIYRCHE